ncbi:MAG: hypothetical protein MR454_04600 [Solobacterium sp.]|nr:hypothetical protein [Solobacterium sp.]
MKKNITLIVCLLLFLVMAMGSGSDTEDTAATQNTETSEVKEQVKKEVTVEETAVFEENSIKITVTGLDTDGWMGPELKLLIENDSASNITVQTRLSSVNGFMVDSSISEDVDVAKKANTGILFSDSDLKNAGIETISNIQFSFHIFDTDSWDTIMDSELITVNTSAADYVQNVDDTGDILVDSDGIKIVARGLDTEDSIFGPSLILYIENNTGRNLTVQARDESVNGFMIDSIMSTDISSGNKALTELTFMSSDLEENSIEEINEIEFSFHIYDYDTYDNYYDTEMLKVEF